MATIRQGLWDNKTKYVGRSADNPNFMNSHYDDDDTADRYLH